MIHILGQIPSYFTLACSGGVDSMVAADFFKRGGKAFQIAFVHHGTNDSEKGQKMVSNFCEKNCIPFIKFRITKDIPKGSSKEEFWRNERYKFLSSLNTVIITAHHLNDVIENWIFTSLNGNPFLIPYRNEKRNVIRPFLLNTKNDLYLWAEKNNIDFVEDESNWNLDFKRNYIRHEIVDRALQVNPGLYKVLRKKIKSSFES